MAEDRVLAYQKEQKTDEALSCQNLVKRSSSHLSLSMEELVKRLL